MLAYRTTVIYKSTKNQIHFLIRFTMNSALTLRNSRMSLVAIVFAALSLAICVAPKVYYAVTPQPELTQDQQITNILLTAKKVSQKLTEQSQGQSVAPQKIVRAYNVDSMSMYGSLSLALLGIFFSVLAYIKKENKRIYIGAIALSSVTILMNFIWIALGIVVLMLILKVLEGFDF